MKKKTECIIIGLEKPGMFDTSVILNLQYFKRDSYISVICQTSDFAVEGRKAVEVTHLALLGVKIAETAFWVYLKKSSRNAAAFLRHDIPGKASKYSPLRIK